MFIKERLKNIEMSGIRTFNELANNVEGVIKLTVGELDFHTPENIKEQTRRALENNHTRYTSNKGILALRSEITKDTMYDAEECILTVGTTEGLAVIIKSIIDQDDEVILLTPGYVGYEPLIVLEKGKCVLLNTLTHDITVENLDYLVTEKTKAILVTNPNNPTGKIFSKVEMKVIKTFVLKHHLLLIADEIYAKITFEDYTSFRYDKDLKKQMLVLDGFSKSHRMTGYRIGYLLGDISLVRHLIKTHQYMVTSATSIAQYALLNQTKHVNKKIVLTLKDRRDLVIKTLDGLGINYIHPDGAFYVFYQIKHTGLDSLSYCKKLLYQEKVALIPGISFLGDHDDYVRLSYAVHMDELKIALARISAFEKSLI